MFHLKNFILLAFWVRQKKIYEAYQSGIFTKVYCQLIHLVIWPLQWNRVRHLHTLLAEEGQSRYYSGHSFWIGAARSASLAGLTDYEIKLLGWWNSDCSFSSSVVPRYTSQDCTNAHYEFSERHSSPYILNEPAADH